MGSNSGQMKKINVGCNTIILKDGKVLLGKRKNCVGEGTWALPGGHLEFGENLIDAAIRELKEELGIKAKKIQLVSVTEGSRYPTDHYIQANFLMEEYSGKISLMEPDKCEGWEYFDFKNLPEIFPPHQKILQSYLQKVVYLR
jgi:8-oxo-dGTP diphosphatase